MLLCAVALSGVCAGISMLSSLAQARATAGLSGADFIKGASAAKAAEMRVVVENIVLAALQGAIAAFLVWLGCVPPPLPLFLFLSLSLSRSLSLSLSRTRHVFM